MDASTTASRSNFRICPFCEESKLVFSGLNEARCPACDHEPSDDFLKTLRQIVDLPEAPETALNRCKRLRAQGSDPKRGSGEQERGDPDEDR